LRVDVLHSFADKRYIFSHTSTVS